MRARQSASIPNTFGQFQHLDVYDKPTETTIATPEYHSSPNSTERCHGMEISDAWEPWPSEPSVLRSSVLAAHCGWMASQEPPHAVCEYARAHWARNHCFPSLGHVHLLYASANPPDPALYPWTTIHGHAPREDACTEGLVHLPAELCICDCAIVRADGERPGPLQLLSRWLVDSGSWRTLPRECLPVQQGGDWNHFLMELYCVAWPVHALGELGDAVRNPKFHSAWLPPVIDAVASNRNIDATILQCSASLRLFEPPPGIIRAIWAAYRDPAAAAGPIASWLAPEPLTSIRWETTVPHHTLPAVWYAAITIFNSWMDPGLGNIEC